MEKKGMLFLSLRGGKRAAEGPEFREIAKYAGQKEIDTHSFDNENIIELRQKLLSRHYETIVVAGIDIYGSVNPEIQAIRSLAIDSVLVALHPGLEIMKEKTASDNFTDLGAWREKGREVLLNILRQCDLVVVKDTGEKDLLNGVGKSVKIRTVKEVREGDFSREKSRNKTISIVMLTYNQYQDTKNCVESLDKYTKGIEYELIFVDNGSNDGTKEYLKKLEDSGRDVKAILNESNLGFSKGNNQGMRVAKGDYVLLLNNDVLLTGNWLERMIACAESDPKIGVVGPITNHAVGQQVVEYYAGEGDAELQKYAVLHLMKNAGYWHETHRIIGFCMLLKREVIDKVGLLDERFGPGGYEDYDYCLRIKQSGFRIMIARDVFVYHIGGQGYQKNNLDYDKLRQKNIGILIDKWCKRSLEIMEQLPNGL
ncbi:MAG: glycosyltransferase family 2 protein [Endomicrobiales bacterium]|nr:glycosyltransferase family 2 protein [Endomicrobiales bacterium]